MEANHFFAYEACPNKAKSAAATPSHTPPQDISRQLHSQIADWNPFEDTVAFGKMTEDHIFGQEFDKIRRGSQSSKYIVTLVIILKTLGNLV